MGYGMSWRILLNRSRRRGGRYGLALLGLRQRMHDLRGSRSLERGDQRRDGMGYGSRHRWCRLGSCRGFRLGCFYRLRRGCQFVLRRALLLHLGQIATHGGKLSFQVANAIHLFGEAFFETIP